MPFTLPQHAAETVRRIVDQAIDATLTQVDSELDTKGTEMSRDDYRAMDALKEDLAQIVLRYASRNWDMNYGTRFETVYALLPDPFRLQYLTESDFPKMTFEGSVKSLNVGWEVDLEFKSDDPSKLKSCEFRIFEAGSLGSITNRPAPIWSLATCLANLEGFFLELRKWVGEDIPLPVWANRYSYGQANFEFPAAWGGWNFKETVNESRNTEAGVARVACLA